MYLCIYVFMYSLVIIGKYSTNKEIENNNYNKFTKFISDIS